MIEAMLTTTDNPHDPFDDWDAWYSFDERQGYHSTGYLARVTKQVEDFGQSVAHSAIEQAIDEVVQLNLLGIFKKVTRVIPDASNTT